ncbi:hypothetical protein N2600_03905 [Rhizobium sp. WSM1274]|uniref:hypothetical protein n=1 Tax=Rhizobium sp. WSM1274 TaxID=3138254 RepID=UPI0021A7692A|nr:hypothetical protein [Rhizobium leguminosarum]UWU29127.1 hypothetical protein N2600_03905 [Rhizobium leguminosarum bv. viciae]
MIGAMTQTLRLRLPQASGAHPRTTATIVRRRVGFHPPDAKKGERLVLLTDAPTATRAEFLAFAESKGAMDMMVPAEVTIGKVPVLRSGKVDFVAARKLVEMAAQGEQAA